MKKTYRKVSGQTNSIPTSMERKHCEIKRLEHPNLNSVRITATPQNCTHLLSFLDRNVKDLLTTKLLVPSSLGSARPFPSYLGTGTRISRQTENKPIIELRILQLVSFKYTLISRHHREKAGILKVSYGLTESIVS